MKVPQQYLDAFAKLLAPRPQIKVFYETKGLLYAAVEHPETFQVFVGVSHDLYHEVANATLTRTGRQLKEFCDVQFVPGDWHPIPISLAQFAVAIPESPYVVAPAQVLKLWPRPL